MTKLAVFDTKIPTFDHLSKEYKEIDKTKSKRPIKYAKAYDAYCQWMALPKQVRKPKTIRAFETKWKIPKNYTAFFRKRKGFREQQYQYFWEWMMDVYPNVVYSVYERAKDKSPSDAKLFAEIIAHKLEVTKPEATIQQINIIGVDQSKIDKLFEPEGVEDAVISTRQVLNKTNRKTS